MTTPKGPALIFIIVIVLLVVAALIYGVRRHEKKAKAEKAAAQRDIVGVPLTQQLAPPGGFTLEQQVVLGENQ